MAADGLQLHPDPDPVLPAARAHRADLAPAEGRTGEAAMSALLEVKNLNKHFGGLHAVKNVTFTVERGEIVGVLGPNGAGKTTLYNLLTGFIAPDPGATVVFDGHNLLGLAPHRIAGLGTSRTF